MNKRVRVSGIILVIICAILMVVPFNKEVHADSGWDTSYGGGSYGGSSYGGSSWGSSYSSHDYSYSSSSSSYSGGGSASVGEIFLFIIIFIIFSLADSRPRYNSSSKISKSYVKPKMSFYDISDDMAKLYGINVKDFKIFAYNRYVEIQNAWSDFDFDKLQNTLTDELYNSYRMQLDALKLKHQKNVMTDINFIKANVFDIKESGNITTVYVYLNISMFDYVVDSNNKVVRGDKRHKVDIEYILEFVKDSSDTIDKCPNCGNEVHMTVSGECEYCRSKIFVRPNEYVMSKKQNIGQRMG